VPLCTKATNVGHWLCRGEKQCCRGTVRELCAVHVHWHLQPSLEYITPCSQCPPCTYVHGAHMCTHESTLCQCWHHACRFRYTVPYSAVRYCRYNTIQTSPSPMQAGVHKCLACQANGSNALIGSSSNSSALYWYISNYIHQLNNSTCTGLLQCTA
jgi:hypothetical protein